ncbi:neutral zinc metallopeptidase [Pseudomonas sp. NPDC087346]|uniref:KPN_02809 family neutral zinc metallopeptidase n=1 Tax=Pseudomonas sp. NPDC087346 TaxID=3364438 RepID=UPI0037FC4E90
MLWNKARPSDNVNDIRPGKDARTTKILGAGLAVVTMAGVGLYSATGSSPVEPTNQPISFSASSASEDPQLKFVESVLGDTEDTWKQLFAETGQHYPPPVLTLFSDGVDSPCGYASPGSGPFYCPANSQLYLDPAFFAQIARQLSVNGEFAQAFMIAHEVGHHVQLELGLSAPLEQALSARQTVIGDSGLEVRAELQADCLAGVWAHHAQQRLAWLEPGDLEDALNATHSIGDDYLQAAQNGPVRPETFSHGTSEQRTRWFSAGFDSGRISACDTFSPAQL